MFEDLKKAITEFKKAQSIALVASSIGSVDKAVAIIALAKVCAAQKKSFQVICPADIKTPIANIFSKENVEISKTLTSKDYIVSVDYSSANIEKVICKKDEEGKKLNFVITPKDDVFNFDNVELISGGGTFDLVFSFGLDDVGEFEDILEKKTVISISRKDVDFAKYQFRINKEKSYSEIVYEFVKAYSSDFSEEILNILLQGIISKYKLLENGNNDGWLIVSKFLKYGADFNKAYRELNYSKDYDNFQLQRKVLENVRVDKKNRVVWSKVALMLDIDASNLDLRGRIVFNICKDFDLAFVIYHLDKNNVKVVIESNDVEKYSAVELARTFSGYGTPARAIFTNGNIPAEVFEKKLFDAIVAVFNIRV